MLEADVPTVGRLELQSHSPWSLSSLVDEIEQERGLVLVAESTSRDKSVPVVVGWCACRYIVPEAELLKIAVNTCARRQGIATELLKHLSRFLFQSSIETLFLEVRSQNQSALKFYLKNGFLHIGERAKYYSNPDDNASLFKKEIVTI
ncbi:MAG: ribosomal-protein-alanine N-acetyltransferase [Desulfotalea sp.]|nr:MAG: ribosomal-protein-alanine N-acetyltransferase [Desulfotalea sp.]